MERFLVVSLDTDQMQWFYDTVLAADAEKASEFICLVRSYVIGADASLASDFQGNATLILNGTEWDASEELSECQDCSSIFPLSRLKYIKDLNQRVEAGEPMPSGECPECGALCQLVKQA